MELVENFEKQFPDTNSLEHTACLAVVMYLFGPLEDEEEVDLYLGIVRRRFGLSKSTYTINVRAIFKASSLLM